jgi:hypothetical protein
MSERFFKPTRFVKTLPVLAIMLVAFVPGFASAALSAIEKDKVITVTAQQLDGLNTYKLDQYSLAAVKNGLLEPIPYQFDEMTKDGFVYIEGADSLALTIEGVKSHIKGKQHFFDEDDELLFMMRDAGSRRSKNMQEPGKVVAEIAVKGSDGKSRYVYLIQDSLITSEDFYIRYSSEIGRAESNYYSLKVDQKNALVWDEFYYDTYEGPNPRQPFDTMKLGMSGHVLPVGGIPVYLSNKSIKAKPLAEKAGPIRATTTFRMTLKFLGIPWFVGKLQIRHMETAVAYDFIMRMPELRRQAMANLRARMTMDGRDLDGAEVVFSERPDEIAKADGKFSDLESAMSGRELSLDANNWIWLDTKEKFATLMTFKLDHITKVDSKANKTRVRYQYKDTREKGKHWAEFYQGQIPDAGFEVRMPQLGRIKMSFVYDMFSRDVGKSAKEVAAEVAKVPKVSIKMLGK